MLPEPAMGNVGEKVWFVGKAPPTVFVTKNVKSTGTAEAAPANTIQRALASNKCRNRFVYFSFPGMDRGPEFDPLEPTGPDLLIARQPNTTRSIWIFRLGRAIALQSPAN
jgi:hypothetical protein